MMCDCDCIFSQGSKLSYVMITGLKIELIGTKAVLSMS